MLETHLQAGSPAYWLPRWEAKRRGNGGMESIDISRWRYQGVTFMYVPFAPNAINTCDAGMLDVISFNFSGCIMATFRSSGVRNVCHVSTGGGQDCGAAWQQLKGGSQNVFAFKPSDNIEAVPGFAGCYGLITPDLRTYAITVKYADGNYTVAAIKTAPLLR